MALSSHISRGSLRVWDSRCGTQDPTSWYAHQPSWTEPPERVGTCVAYKADHFSRKQKKLTSCIRRRPVSARSVAELPSPTPGLHMG